MIFLFKKLKWELAFLSEHLTALGFSAFICCFGGILLWVNGTNIWHIYNLMYLPDNTISVTGIFLISLGIYGICGILLALFLICGQIYRTSSALLAFTFSSLIYLFMLIWYVLFFCTHLTFFALILLILTILLSVLLFLKISCDFIIVRCLLTAIFVAELYFFYIHIGLLHL